MIVLELAASRRHRPQAETPAPRSASDDVPDDTGRERRARFFISLRAERGCNGAELVDHESKNTRDGRRAVWGHWGHVSAFCNGTYWISVGSASAPNPGGQDSPPSPGTSRRRSRKISENEECRDVTPMAHNRNSTTDFTDFTDKKRRASHPCNPSNPW